MTTHYLEWSRLIVAEDGLDEAQQRAFARPQYNPEIDDDQEDVPLTCELRRGERHYLEGRAIHCGDVFVMQERIEHPDREKREQGWTAPGPRGHRVRYELEHPGPEHPRAKHGVCRVAVLYVDVGGFTFSGRLEEWARFRWKDGAR